MSDDTLALLKQVDEYIEGLFAPNDEVQQRALEDSEEAGLPGINVSASQGKFLYLVTKMTGARRILEIGTLGGYSTIWLARALPDDGRLISLEFSPKHAEVARANIERAGFGSKVEVRVGAAVDSLARMEERGEGPFDLFFIDADKPSYPAYLEACLRLSRPGSVILSDNLIREGAVLDPAPDDSAASSIADFNRELASHPRLESLILLMTRKHVDGLGVSVVV